jgi:hypothetical protein
MTKKLFWIVYCVTVSTLLLSPLVYYMLKYRVTDTCKPPVVVVSPDLKDIWWQGYRQAVIDGWYHTPQMEVVRDAAGGAALWEKKEYWGASSEINNALFVDPETLQLPKKER